MLPLSAWHNVVFTVRTTLDSRILKPIFASRLFRPITASTLATEVCNKNASHSRLDTRHVAFKSRDEVAADFPLNDEEDFENLSRWLVLDKKEGEKVIIDLVMHTGKAKAKRLERCVLQSLEKPLTCNR